MHLPTVLATLLLAVLTGGCGLRGPLHLPDEDQPGRGEPVAEPPPGPDAEEIIPPAEGEAGDIQEGVETVREAQEEAGGAEETVVEEEPDGE